ncbi:hypothetical protein [Kocuria arenosa]|uniref:hypothetical protein n=1 Tax=Kocuria arenosa TaxID=3071446 RepID=UPI0034D78125
MPENEVAKPVVHLKMDSYVIVENIRELQQFARRTVIARAHEFDSGDLEDELQAIANSPADAISICLDAISFIESIPGVIADAPGVSAYDLFEAEGRKPSGHPVTEDTNKDE